jgi:hypothetical protein
LFDISIANPFNQSRRLLNDFQGEAIEVRLGHGQIRVPLGSNLIVYAGRDAEVRHIRGRVLASVGRDLSMQDVQTLVHAAAGGDLNIDCATLGGDEIKFSAGRDLRFHARDLDDAKVMITEAGTYWEAVLAAGGAGLVERGRRGNVDHRSKWPATVLAQATSSRLRQQPMNR